MTPEEFRTTIMEPMLNDAKAIIKAKGNDYTDDGDFLYNFKNAAKEAGVTTLQAWYIYTFKHWCAIRTYIQDGQVESEDIHERIKDVINYMLLLAGIITESKEPSEMDDNLEAVRKAIEIEDNPFPNVTFSVPPIKPGSTVDVAATFTRDIIAPSPVIDNTGLDPSNPNWQSKIANKVFDPESGT